MTCRHCSRGKANNARNLCAKCFANPEVRRQYPIGKYVPATIPTGKSVHEVVDLIYAQHPLWYVSQLASDDPAYTELVQKRVKAGLPARHPEEVRRSDLR